MARKNTLLFLHNKKLVKNLGRETVKKKQVWGLFGVLFQIWPLGHTNDVGTNRITCQESSIKNDTSWYASSNSKPRFLSVGKHNFVL